MAQNPTLEPQKSPSGTETLSEPAPASRGRARASSGARRRTRLAQAPTKPAKAPVEVVKPHPLVWAAALRLAKGDRSRLRVDGPESVVVLNSAPVPSPAKKARR